MRITNSIIQRTALDNLQRNMQRIADAQEEASTGLRIRTASDDPNAAAQVMRHTESLHAIDQYKRNIGSAQARLNVEEGILDRITQTLDRAKELGLGQGQSTANAQSRLVTKAEVDQLIGFVKELGNQRHEGEYLFGGITSDVRPFTSTTPPFSAAPPTGSRQTEITSGMMVKENHNGTEVFLTTNVLGSLDELSTALGNNDEAAIQASLMSLDGAHVSIQALLGEVGARTSQLEITTSNLDAVDGQLKTLRSDLQDADMEKTITELVGRQTAYQAAMIATSRLIGMNLSDYLR